MNFDTKKILEKIKTKYGLKSEAELSVFLDVATQTLYTWKRRNSIDLDKILGKCLDVDLNWLLTDKEASVSEPTTEYRVTTDNQINKNEKLEKTIETHLRTIQRLEKERETFRLMTEFLLKKSMRDEKRAKKNENK